MKKAVAAIIASAISGVIEAKRKDGKAYPYTVIAIIEKSNRSVYGSWIRDRRDVIREISGIVYGHMERTYNLK